MTALLILFALYGLFLYKANASERTRIADDQYAVWSDFLNEHFLDDWGNNSTCTVVIRERTTRHEGDKGTFRDALLASLPSAFRTTPTLGAAPETLRSFSSRNGWRQIVTRRFLLNGRYVLAPETDVDLFFTETVRFNSRYADSCGGYIELSAAGFNAYRTEALFRADHICGLCGEGGYVLMRKSGQKWRIVVWQLTWVS